MSTIKDRFESLNPLFLAFDGVSEKLSNRPDVCAIMFLDRWLPSSRGSYLICSGSYDEIWFDVSGDELNTLSDEQLKDLVCCGMRYDEEHDRLCKFV